MNFPIFFENRTVGEVQVQKKGLYYQFACQCTPPDHDIYRIVISCGNTEQSLGICVPDGKHFALSKQMPMKSIRDGEWEFYLRPKDAVNNIVAAVSEDAPFPLLDKLEHSSLLVENGEAFIAIRDEA